MVLPLKDVGSNLKVTCISNVGEFSLERCLKKIFVKISDYHEWTQYILYEIRQNQLAEEKRIEDEQIYNEIKKQKRLELTRKIFYF